MRFRIARVAAAAALVAGIGAVAYAESPRVHVLHVALPDGSVETVHYTGDRPPLLAIAAPDAGDPFAGFDRVAAMMDRQADALWQQVAAMSAPAAGGPDSDAQFAALAQQPAGARYSYTSTTVVNGHACTTSVKAISAGAGEAPRLLRRVSGDGCTAAAKPAGPVPAVAPAPPAAPATPHLVSAPAAPKPPAPDTI